MISLRNYQRESLDALYHWWIDHPGILEAPILVAPTGSGKSVTIAELVRLMWTTWPEDKPRTLVVVPSRELAEQNAEKLKLLLPNSLSVGFYSSSIGKHPDADVIVATIGSVYKAAHIIGNIKAVIIDECHLINTSGHDVGRYRQFLNNLKKYCTFRVVGFTATPFRGNGVWLTDGDSPLFTGVAHTIKIQDLLDKDYLSPLVRPIDAIKTRIDTAGISTTSGDYNLEQLSNLVEDYLDQVVSETLIHASDRKKWIAFTPTVINAEHLVERFRQKGISCDLVCGSTKKTDRKEIIDRFRNGEIKCLVTVLALAVGFDVPDVDCIIWCRPTQSPVLYVQGAGRGLRIAPGKKDCLWLDYSDTTERLGPVDGIKGRKSRKKVERDAPTKTCEECGEKCSASARICPSCGTDFPIEQSVQDIRKASNAAVMMAQVHDQIVYYTVTDVRYAIHKKEGSPDSLRVDYWSGLRKVASEWICFEHKGWARAKAEQWWKKRDLSGIGIPIVSDEAYKNSSQILRPSSIAVNESQKFPSVASIEF